MKRQPVTSSNLASVGYDDAAQTLEVEFLDGSIYQYFGVPSAAHSALLGAESVGTRDEKWIAIACSNDKIFERLAIAMGRAELAGAEQYGPKEKRLAARDDVNNIVAGWVASLDCTDVLAQCQQAGTPASLIYSIADIFEDPQYLARENIRMMESRIGPVAVPGVVPKLSETPGEIKWLGEALGARNHEVLGTLLGIGAAELESLAEVGII